MFHLSKTNTKLQAAGIISVGLATGAFVGWLSVQSVDSSEFIVEDSIHSETKSGDESLSAQERLVNIFRAMPSDTENNGNVSAFPEELNATN